MKVADLLESRRKNWQQLEDMCTQMESRRKRRLGPLVISRFAALYRAACADLALADAYQLPPKTVHYLHRLVGRAYNQLYRSRTFDFATWGSKLLVEAPQTVFCDRYVRICFCLFWGVFLLSAMIAASPSVWPTYAEAMLGTEFLGNLETMFSQDLGRSPDEDLSMVGFYIFNNTGIGLKCFAFMLLIIPGFYVTVYNAAVLGASFGYMSRPDVSGTENFYEFVTAHAPFELTAIVLAAGAGLRLGMSWVDTRGMTRVASMQRAGREVVPAVGAMMILFVMAAMIEGFLSPSAAPYWVKFSVLVLSILLLLVYFVGLGYLRR